jgi:hypothetical protein
MVNIEQIQKDINELPEEAQTLLTDFIDVLKKRYSVAEKQEVKSHSTLSDRSSTLNILKKSGLIGCISAVSELSTNYKFINLRSKKD